MKTSKNNPGHRCFLCWLFFLASFFFIIINIAKVQRRKHENKRLWSKACHLLVLAFFSDGVVIDWLSFLPGLVFIEREIGGKMKERIGFCYIRNISDITYYFFLVLSLLLISGKYSDENRVCTTILLAVLFDKGIFYSYIYYHSRVIQGCP